ncbi:hypothetical protein F183_A16220 [Bryobacterales bacterium F-183]|nr:hypothetical protein F183_A16220 [Bryobacterales bacterium F-183]
MTRRRFLPAAAGAAAVSSAQSTGVAQPAVFEMRIAYLRNGADQQRQRLAEFIEKSTVPALQKYGAGPVGVFSNLIAPDGPYIMAIVQYPSLAAMEETRAKMNEDAAYQKATDKLLSAPGLPYVRLENSILRGVPWMPAIEVPKHDGKRANYVFELRTYESNTTASLAKKVKMFADGEMAIFRRLGMIPVLFGTTVVGRRMPNLVYMLGYENLAAREKVWQAFVRDPEWAKLRDTPGLSDAEVVSNISSVLLSPLGFSQVR